MDVLSGSILESIVGLAGEDSGFEYLPVKDLRTEKVTGISIKYGSKVRLSNFEEWDMLPLLILRASQGINRNSTYKIYTNNVCTWIRYKKHGYYSTMNFYFVDHPGNDEQNHLCKNEDEANFKAVMWVINRWSE